MSEPTERLAQRYLNYEDVTGDWLPNTFLLMEGGPEWGFPFAAAYVKKHTSSVPFSLCEDLVRAACYVLSDGCRRLLNAEIKNSAENVLNAIMALPHERDLRGNPCPPQINNIDDNILDTAWELAKRLASENCNNDN